MGPITPEMKEDKPKIVAIPIISGGVDSAVATLIATEKYPRVQPVFIESFLRIPTSNTNLYSFVISFKLPKKSIKSNTFGQNRDFGGKSYLRRYIIESIIILLYLMSVHA